VPGLEQAEFARLGGMHRNTFLNSPVLLDSTLRLKAAPHIRFAGQITGCEGYVESAATGLLAARFCVAERSGRTPDVPPQTSAHGALLAHITGGHLVDPDRKQPTFQPMNVNFGLFPPIEVPTRHEDGSRIRGKEKTQARRQAISARALRDMDAWIAGQTGLRAA
jgi:methylenetetrahydrofolate--tRNA-(uracil-5-)-methyltransferase